MGDCSVFYDEIRFSVRDPDKTEMWVFIRGEGDCPFQALGWHYKTFPSSVTTMQILAQWAAGAEDPLKWERRDPPPTEPNYNPDWDAIEADLKARFAFVPFTDKGPKADE